jgi:predicted DNA-binding antitoxin AbrB/MazE fold protein
MTRTVEAIYENGVLKLPAPLPLPENTPVTVTIESELAVAEDAERTLWLKASEQTLTKAWDNSADDVFNALLKG